ncbi:Golgin sub A member 7 [Kickxella alabastrina]|uniref:Golgin sub A member 7 n=1 Tax=Kickxella alabastrina TaxID=61397 RepID=A0ACC1IGD1_9FUNG|nr:Golgin sub A member 7 [Kickxella alabastrina]
MSVVSSTEHWSFENLTQSIDSGYPLLSSTNNQTLKQQQQQQHHNPPLSLVISLELRNTHSNTILYRSPSTSSSHALQFQRKQQAQRPNSYSSETFSIHTYLQQQQQQQHQHPAIYAQKQHSIAMFATAEANRQQYRNVSSSTSVNCPIPSQSSGDYSELTPRSSVYSEKAIFAGSSSASPTAPAAVAVAQARQLDGSREKIHRPSVSEGVRPQSIVALSSASVQRGTPTPNTAAVSPSGQQHWSPQPNFYPTRGSSLGVSPSSELPAAHNDGRGNSNTFTVDTLSHKSYALPETNDSTPQNALEYSQWQRIRIERDYSMGVSRQFTVKVPDQLVGKIDERRFKKFIRRVNKMLAEAEGATVRNVLEGCLAFATLYLSTLVIKPHFRKTIDRISALVRRENEVLFRPAGFLAIDPKQTAYMFIEIVPL